MKSVKLPSGEVLDAADLVQYAPGAIISRTLSNTPAGTVTMFAFAAGQGLSEHSTPFDAIIQILDGQAQLAVGGRNMTARAGQMVAIPADVPHSILAVQQFKMLLIMLQG